MTTKLTGSLAVCVAAALFTAGALVLNNDSPGPSPEPGAIAATAGGTEPGATAAPRPGGYGTAAKGSGSNSTAGAQAAATLEIEGLAFSPVTAGPRARVPIQSRDSVPHTVTADGGAFDSGRIGPNGTATIVAPAAPGTYRFTCLIHPQMTGTLVVR